jgi:hypothetical protein
MSTGQALARLGSVSAFFGAIVLFASTLLHPLSRDPNSAPEAFAEYAADALYVWSHLGQFVGLALLGVALVALAATFEPGRASAWARIGLAGAMASVAVAGALQAVDGVALKATVDRWAAASGEARATVFEAALAVRQVEIGLASCELAEFNNRSHTYRLQPRDAPKCALPQLAGRDRSPGWRGVGGGRCRASRYRFFRRSDGDQHDGKFGAARLVHPGRHSHGAIGVYILSGRHQRAGTLFQIFSVIVEKLHDPIFTKIEFGWDIKKRITRIEAPVLLRSER